MGHLLDGGCHSVVGTHTHTPTLDYRIWTRVQLFKLMQECVAIIILYWNEKENAILRSLKKTDRLVPAMEAPTISGIIVEGNNDTGLVKNIYPILIGGNLKIQKLVMAGHITLGRY